MVLPDNGVLSVLFSVRSTIHCHATNCKGQQTLTLKSSCVIAAPGKHQSLHIKLPQARTSFPDSLRSAHWITCFLWTARGK